MVEYITAENLIKEAKSKKIDLGKGDPYNRLRYYTKIEWLPNMTRKKDTSGNVVGHYPAWALERLELIDELKGKGLSNDEISEKLTQEDRKRNIRKGLKFLSTSENRLQTIAYVSLALLLLILATEIGAIKVGRTTKQDLIKASTNVTNNFEQVLDSGTNTLPQNEKLIYVKTSKVSPISKIHITFENNYGPATRYWVTKKISFEGFYIETDLPVAQDATFNWWLTN